MTDEIQIQLTDFEPEVSDVLQEILEGLTQSPKYLSAKFNYDEKGAKLYERICETNDYYCTRTELAILHQHKRQIKECFDDEILLIEFGSGSGKKTKFLFDHLPNISSYIPIDISKRQLIEYSWELENQYPHLEILPVCADYTQPLFLPTPDRYFYRRLIFWLMPVLDEIARSWDDRYDLILLVCHKDAIPLKMIIEATQKFNEEYKPVDLMCVFTFPDCDDPIYRVFTSPDKYIITAIQRRERFLEAYHEIYRRGYRNPVSNTRRLSRYFFKWNKNQHSAAKKPSPF